MLAAGVLLALLAAAPPDAEQISRALEETWRKGDYQRELPSPTSPTRPRPPEPSSSSSSSSGSSGSGGSGLATALLWVLGGAAVLVLAVAVAEGLRGERERRSVVAAPPSHAPPVDPAVVAGPLADADALAREGRFADAIHVLLLRLLGELSSRTRPPIADSLTSREIVDRVALPDAARPPLAHLVGAVEATHFGDDVPSRDDYDRCLDRYRAFAAAYAGAAS